MAKNILVSWLNDAYAMEQAQIKMLNRFINDFDDYPLIQEVLTDHLEETKAQANSIKECVENMDENVSTTKSILGNMMGTLQGASTSAYEDEIVKDMIMIHAGEQF
ncbi:DUF892 family protein [Candidatus Saccharibacteria bacterium]|nr:DUF892 family protein [Candidatus Saccharibacteria bacterium]